MEELAFEKVSVAVDVPGGQRQTLGKGRLVVSDGGMDLLSEKGDLAMRPVRSVEMTSKGVYVEFGEGSNLRKLALINLSDGAFRYRSANKAMVEALHQSLQLKGLSAAETADRDRTEATMARAVMQKAKTQMWIGGVVAVAGAIATVVSMSASDGGGTYYVFWGAVVFGILGVLEAYFDRYRKYKKVLEKEGATGTGAGTPA